MKIGTVEIRCSSSSSRGKHRYAVISILDEGPGIPEENREKFFNPFFTTRENGTGLGLSVAARIVDRHGGFIETENREEGGAIFSVFLPSFL